MDCSKNTEEKQTTILNIRNIFKTLAPFAKPPVSDSLVIYLLGNLDGNIRPVVTMVSQTREAITIRLNNNQVSYFSKKKHEKCF